MPLRDSHHRENGRGDGIFAQDMPTDFADVTRAEGLFNFQHFQKYGLQAMAAVGFEPTFSTFASVAL